MSLKCTLGFHNWDGYKCRVCGKADMGPYGNDLVTYLYKDNVIGSVGHGIPRNAYSVAFLGKSICITVPLMGSDCYGNYSNARFPSNMDIFTEANGKVNQVFKALAAKLDKHKSFTSSIPIKISVEVWTYVSKAHTHIYSGTFNTSNLSEYNKRPYDSHKHWEESYNGTRALTLNKL